MHWFMLEDIILGLFMEVENILFQFYFQCSSQCKRILTFFALKTNLIYNKQQKFEKFFHFWALWFHSQPSLDKLCFWQHSRAGLFSHFYFLCDPVTYWKTHQYSHASPSSQRQRIVDIKSGETIKKIGTQVHIWCIFLFSYDIVRGPLVLTTNLNSL